MARFIGTPGESAYVHGAKRVAAISLMLFFVLFLPVLYGIVFYTTLWGFVGTALIVIAVATLIRWRRTELLDSWRFILEGRMFMKGAVGETRVHEALRVLPEEYIVFHDFHPRDTNGRPSKWNVDHIVVGPTGVFVLDAKNYSTPRVPSAEHSVYSKKNAGQAQRNAMELKDKLVRWSGGELQKLFVVPVVVYTQDGASLERLREGPVRTLPLRLLVNEILTHSESSIDLVRAGRVARVLFSQVPADLQYAFRNEIDAYGSVTKAALYAERDARLAAAYSDAERPSADAPPERCPRCGGQLVRLTARRGPRAGKPFLGCENYQTTGCCFGFNLD